MDVIDLTKHVPQRAHAAIFQGLVHTLPLVDERQGAQQLRILSVTFAPGARTKLHYHTHDQVLVITEGRGILATEHEEHHVTPGCVVYVPPGERHWHGAEPEFSMTHLSINGPGETHIVEP
ncbi:MAG TPA: cupin domain-containing protein [Chloroflexota bacterium]|nr:cupin domain-containing protein [Chloroflexota bacterium]